MNKLDCFFTNKDFADEWEDVTAVVGGTVFFDLCPVLLKPKVADFGPSPFRCYYHWLTLQGFQTMVKDLWDQTHLSGSTDFILKEKFKALKKGITAWRHNTQPRLAASAEATKSTFLQVERQADIRNLEIVEWDTWKELKIKFLVDQKNITKDLKQKARVKWAIEGDESNKFFHAIVQGRRGKNDLKGLLLNRTCIKEPISMKQGISDFFREHFKEPNLNRPKFTNQRFKKLNDEDSKALEAAFTDLEISNVVWLCGGSKAPGPDGFNFNFIKAT